MDPVTNAGQVEPVASSVLAEEKVMNVANADISSGYPVAKTEANVPENVPTEGVEAQTPPDGTNTPVVETNAAMERLKQQNSANGKLLAALGVDPLSDLGEQLEQGLITPDMIRAHVMKTDNGYTNNPSRPPDVQAQPQQGSVESLQQNLADIRAKYNEEAASGNGITIETNNALFDAQQQLNDARLDNVTRQITAKEQAQQVNENVNAVLSVARSQDEYSKMDQSMQKMSEEVTLSYTGMLANQKAAEMGLDLNSLTPQQYTYFANQATGQLDALANHYMELGRAEVRNGINPAQQLNNGNVPIPAGPSNTPVAVPNGFDGKITMNNHEAAAKAWVAQNTKV